jgi:hypothetical protein
MPNPAPDDAERRAKTERQTGEPQAKEPQAPTPATDLDAPATPDSTPPDYNTWHTGP